MTNRPQDTTGPPDTRSFPAPDLFYVFGDGADHLLADLHQMVTIIYQTLIPPEKRHPHDVGSETDFGEDEPDG